MTRPPPRSPLFPSPTLSRSVGPPVRLGFLAARVEREHHARIRGGTQQRQQRARQSERREQIDAQRREPLVERLMLDRPHRGHRSEEHMSELQSLAYLVCRLL